GIVDRSCVRNGCITATVSYEIASTVRPRSVYRSYSFWTPGIARTHGPHQVPQNSSSTTRPFRDSRVGASPFQLSQAAAWIGGASLPTAGCWAGQWTAVVSSTGNADNRCWRMMRLLGMNDSGWHLHLCNRHSRGAWLADGGGRVQWTSRCAAGAPRVYCRRSETR